MKIQYQGKEYNLCFNENGAMFTLENSQYKVIHWMSARRAPDPGFNQAYILDEYVDAMVDAGIVTRTSEGWTVDEGEHKYATLCDIVHPEFNDGGYSNFGDFCRSRLHQQCQYGSRYIEGKLEGYPALGEGLRFHNGFRYGRLFPLDASDYHSVKIHRDDMDEFERRYKEYQNNRPGMFA